MTGGHIPVLPSDGRTATTTAATATAATATAATATAATAARAHAPRRCYATLAADESREGHWATRSSGCWEGSREQCPTRRARGIAWIVAVAAHLVLNERHGLGPPHIEFKHADP
ncbi:hypothetical protein ABZZ20_04490 [Streptomyces sp. NPDC006430]|uniref:hypothetical protein n=1 Tax=Streptomyces sp. NPDC006430 TaxID=3154299 RepID=UPI0033A8DDFA